MADEAMPIRRLPGPSRPAPIAGEKARGIFEFPGLHGSWLLLGCRAAGLDRRGLQLAGG